MLRSRRMKRYHAKITPPKLGDVLVRERLFTMLDGIACRPVTWVSSQAGSGKTTLLASYLKARDIPFLWYRVDEADNDPAGLFYFMSEAAQSLRRGRKRPLPLFTAECRSGMFDFTRYFFESLFNRMEPPYAIVFDNYQDVPEPSQFHDVMRGACGLVPEGIRIFVASRNDCPPSFVPLKVGGMLASLGWEDIRFTLDEIRQMLSLRKKDSLSLDALRSIHRQTRGWAAGAILMSEQDLALANQQPIFDYLAVEVMRQIPESLKEFLLKTSFLPSISPDMATRLTGMNESGTLLARLRGHYFTEVYGQDYSYHPLFREFLQAQARKTYADEYSLIASKAGRTLAQSGRREEAIRVLLDAGVYDEALSFIVAQAPECLRQGRGAALEEWAVHVPDDLRGRSPWLSYWLGMGRLVDRSRIRRGMLREGFRAFRGRRR